jgi:excisionase family DNA binding protein
MAEMMLKVPEAAEQLRVTEETVRRWLRSGKLRGRRLGPTKAGYRIPQSEVDRLLDVEPEDPTEPPSRGDSGDRAIR